MVVAIHSQAPEVNLFQVFWKELEMVGGRGYQRTGLEGTASLLADRAIPADALITDVLPLADAPGSIEWRGGGGDVVTSLIAAA